MSKVFVLDTDKQPLTPVHPGGARHLLKEGKAAVYRRYPFTIILKRRVEAPAPAPLRLKIDPGAKTTGLALVNDATGEVVWAAELTHRGAQIKKVLDKRRGVRRGRRSRWTRYRAPRFHNRRRRAGWFPPSLLSRVENILTWVARLCCITHITALSQELVRFDLQKMENPEIAGVVYQQGELFGYEVREYVLEKWGRRCAYCGIQGVPLQVEHIHSRAKGGSNRVSNLCLACEPCNRKKGTQDIRDFLAHDPEQLTRILKQAKVPLKDATAVNATGRGHRRLCNTNELGFPVSYRQRHKRYFGFQTGDQVRAVVPEALACRGTHVGRVAVRAKGTFDITTKHGKITDVPHRFCQLIGRTNGYNYQIGERHATPPPTNF